LHRSLVPAIRISITGLLLCALGAAVTAIDTGQPAQTGTLNLTPKDTFLNTNKKNYSTSTTLPVYTWPDRQPANAVVMKFDFSPLPAGATVTQATLHLALVANDTSTDPSYTVTAHKILGKNPNIAKVTGFSVDGVVPWTPNNCCASSAPLAQADLSAPYDTRVIDKVKNVKTWNVTAMVQEWLLNPATNLGLVLNADRSKPRDRYRSFASMEHSNAQLRPYLQVTYVAGDATPPSVSLTSPAPGDVAGLVALAADATDNAAVASVQFHVNGTPACAEQSAAPYVFNWDSTTQSDGTYAITAVARDTSGNVATSLPVPVTVKNGVLVLMPEDTTLNINANNYSADQMLTTYTWPDQRPANAVLMKFDLSAVPAGAIVNDATLLLSLVQSDAVVTETYNVTANKVVGRNPVIAQATGYLADAATNWTPSGCCHNGVPLAQADISPPYATVAVDAVPGLKSWAITSMVQEWLADPVSNFGLLLNSDATKVGDRYRFFASMEHPVVTLRPMLRVHYSLEDDTTAPTVAITAPAAGQTVANVTAISASASDSAGVAGVQLHLNGEPLGPELTAPYSFNWDTRSVANGQYSLTAVARDVRGNSAVSSPVGVVVANDSTVPVISGVTVSGVTANGAVISWTTDEASDSQVEYGPTASYGMLSALDGGFTGAHSVTLSGLADATLYHFRVRSRDRSGNLATSGDSTLTTVDGTAPAVSISAPAGAATVSGAITVTANATDNVGVAGVQFKLGGVNLGAEDTSSPYSAAWDTTTVADGGHTLTAVARDAAGNVTTSAAVSVTVTNDTTLPVISGVNATSVTANAATITWTTNEASDSQVEYGTTTAYGTVTPLAAALVAAHSVSLAGLSDATQYHYRVRSRDHTGNLSTSGDFTFTTFDGTAPSVAVTTPAAGASVSGTISVAANAGDNVGVAGVQFTLDGANLGAEDTAAPYSISWDTAGVASGSHTLTAVARDTAGNSAIAAAVTVTVNAGVLVLVPEDTSLNINANNYSADPLLTTYTWPDQQVANAVLLKFDLSSLPANAVVQQAALRLALVESDESTLPTYSVAAHKVIGRNPVLSAATGYTFDGVTQWTANACCHNGIPLAQADISAVYDTQAIDKVAGFKSWSIATMVQEWLADPASNFGMLLNSDGSAGVDRYRFFASMEHADPALRPSLHVTYTIPVPDSTPPSVAITSPAPGATVSGTASVTANASDNIGILNVQFKLDGVNLDAADATSPYAFSWNTATTTNGSHTLTAVARDAAGNTTTSAPVTITVSNAIDATAPSVAMTAPAQGATVSGTVTVSASASDNVGVTSVQFKLDGANLGALDTSAPYALSWSTTAVPNGVHTLTAVARDAAGNQTTSATVSVTVSNTTSPNAPEAICPGGSAADANVLWCENFQKGDYLSRWIIGSNNDQWPSSDFVKNTNFGYNDSSAAWTNNLVFDHYWGYFGFDASDYFPPQSEFYIRFYQYVSNPYTWGSLEDKSVLLHDVSRSLDMYIATSRSGDDGCDGTSGSMGKPAFANYQDRDWPELGGQCTKVNRYQNQGNDITLQPGKWYLFEAYIRLNTAGSNNGILKLWIDDASVPVTTQTLRMHYTDMRFLRSGDAGKKLSELRLTVYNQRCDSGAACPSQRTQFHKWDNFVIGKTPIGPMR
jgi:hypothetical protein